jgi:hypothetical protein
LFLQFLHFLGAARRPSLRPHEKHRQKRQ